ncbi:MAG: LysR family transcriptional regulator [Aphanocapsa lilacina HA4352-LM1]|nr:LysR family transcriptional regulator [Aphanocapsa lilacina HA4352-LM1]
MTQARNRALPSDTNDMAIFACVVNFGSFARAAEEHNLTPSAVSRIISRLELRLGARLLQRSTRKLSLTEAGAIYHARALQILADVAEAEAEVAAANLQPRGTLKLSVPVVFGRLHVAPLIGRLMRQFPELAVELTLTDRFVDLIEEGIDLALRIGALPDSRLIARRLCTNRRILVASPDYLARAGIPVRPADLTRHSCLIFTALTRPRDWRLVGPEGTTSVSVTGRLIANNGDALLEAALEGLGICPTATFVAVDLLMRGELVRVLPEHEFEPTAVHAVYPSARQLSTKVRSAVDLLVKTFADPPPWDRLPVPAPPPSARR